MNIRYITSMMIKIFIFLTFLFARSFMGLSYYGVRLGEVLMAISAIVLVIYAVMLPIFKKKYFLDNKRMNIVIIILFISFFLVNILEQTDFLNLAIYKSSSYIWSLGGLIFGYNIASLIGFKIYEQDIYLSLLGLFIIYVFSTRGISENLQNVLLEHTDKFEYPKGSDLLLAFVFIFYILLENKKYSKSSLLVLVSFSALYVPLFLVKSRSGFISLIIFLLLIIPKFKKIDFKVDAFLLFSVILSILIFLMSTSWVVSKDIVIDEEIDQELKFAITSRYSTINDNVYEEEVLNLNIFYFNEGRIFSSDGNLNWRLQIWQDIFIDMTSDNILINGYGFSNIIPAMDSDQRGGQDSQNVNVHNYFVHILSRGGFLHLILIGSLYYYLLRKFSNSNNKHKYLLIVLPLIFNSLFDPSMENSHYSIILYFLIGLALKKPIILKEGN
jgi:hypothetical protein